MSYFNKKSAAMISAILCFFTIFSFTACTVNEKINNNDNKKLSIVCTIFPEYDWVKQILGDNLKDTQLTMLLNNGVDLHNYQSTADNLVKISNCDMFIYVGGESDGWVDDALKNAVNKDMIVINLIEVLGDSIKSEEMVEGMQAETLGNDAGTKEEKESDEHIWLSLRNAVTLCNHISEKLQTLDKTNADTYKANTAAYINELNNLDKQFRNVVDKANKKTVLFGDRFPFRYLVDDYGLSYYAAFSGCSAETEASFETISFLANKTDELQLPAVLTLEGTDHSIAKTIVENTKSKNQKILSLDSMQSTTTKDIDNGVTYLSVMQNNLSVLENALS